MTVRAKRILTAKVKTTRRRELDEVTENVDMSSFTDTQILATLTTELYQNRVKLTVYREALKRDLIQPGMGKKEVAWELAKTYRP